MKLIYDEFDSEWLWVDDYDENIEFSPKFDEEEYAVAWRDKVAKELDNDINKLYNGDNVVLPRSKEHAEAMLRVATFYLNQNP